MRAPLHDDINCLAINLLHAAENGKPKDEAKAYRALKALCEEHCGGELDHPLQWEALGDFSAGHEQAMAAYASGLQCAERLGIDEYLASINLAMAEAQCEAGDEAAALAHVQQAAQYCDGLDDAELGEAVGQLLAQLQGPK